MVAALSTARIRASCPTGMVVILAAVIATGCGIPIVRRALFGTFSNVSAAERTAEQVAQLDHGVGSYVTRIVRVADQAVVYDAERDRDVGRFILIPDTYVINYFAHSHKVQPVARSDTVQLKAGHVYRTRERECFDINYSRACDRRRSYAHTVWLEDATTRQVVAGAKW